VEPGLEGGPVVLHHLAAGELAAGGQCELVEAGVVEILERGADDPALGEEAGMGEPEQPGEELPAGQVARRPEQHDHVAVESRRVVQGLGDLRICGGEEVGVGDGAHLTIVLM
jgi:hypothetical protein